MQQRIFFPESAFSADPYGAGTPQWAIPCINSCCTYIKDPVVRVRVQWIMETLKHPLCTVGWVMQLSQLAFPWEETQIFHGRHPSGIIQLKKGNKLHCKFFLAPFRTERPGDRI